MSQMRIQLDGLTLLSADYMPNFVQQTRLLEILVQQQKGEGSDSSLTDDGRRNNSPISEASPGTMEMDAKSASNSDQQKVSPSSDSALQIRATRYGCETSCGDWCSCNCHKTRALRTPATAMKFLGLLFIGYAALPCLARPCNENFCKRKTAPTLKITYYFPTMFLHRVFQFMFSSSLSGGPQISLRIQRVIPDIADVFLYACQGNLNGIRMLFGRRLASPFDKGNMTGRIPLHYAVNYNHPELARFLIEAGASPHEEDMEQTTPVALAWRRIFGALSAPSTLDSPRLMFEDEEFLDSRAFQPLHKIVLGLSGASLKERLQLSTTDIDEVDSDGRTALSWAATRDDVEAVKTLRAFGASPAISSIWGQLPLHCAVHNKTQSPVEILENLIVHGTNVNAVDYWNRTPLFYVSGNYNGLEAMQLLVSSGAAINLRDRRLRTPLGYTARLGHIEHARYLVERQADPNIPDEFNVIPIFDTVRNNFHDVCVS